MFSQSSMMFTKSAFHVMVSRLWRTHIHLIIYHNYSFDQTRWIIRIPFLRTILINAPAFFALFGFSAAFHLLHLHLASLLGQQQFLWVPWSGALTGVLTLTYMSSLVEGNQCTQEKPTQTQVEHANSTRKAGMARIQIQDPLSVRQLLPGHSECLLDQDLEDEE